MKKKIGKKISKFVEKVDLCFKNVETGDFSTKMWKHGIFGQKCLKKSVSGKKIQKNIYKKNRFLFQNQFWAILGGTVTFKVPILQDGEM